MSTVNVKWVVRALESVFKANINCSCLTDTHRWFTPKISGTIPGARDGHSACVLGKAMYIFGGYEQLVSLYNSSLWNLFPEHENMI